MFLWEWPFGYEERRLQLVSKIYNLCDPNPPTLQTDGQTDMQSQDRALHYSNKTIKHDGRHVTAYVNMHAVK